MMFGFGALLPESHKEAAPSISASSVWSVRVNGVANIYRVVVGRLVEVRLDSSVRTVDDVNEWFAGFAAAASRRPPGSLAVVAADWRNCPLLSVDAAETARQRLAGNNPHVERSAALASPGSAVTVLQFLRLC